MSVFAQILNKPIKIKDLNSMGFIVENREFGAIATIPLDNIEYCLHLTEIKDGKFWGFKRYAGNSPAFNFLLGALIYLGYKNVKIEGERQCISHNIFLLNFYIDHIKTMRRIN